jgi:hypothetical protein
VPAYLGPDQITRDLVEGIPKIDLEDEPIVVTGQCNTHGVDNRISAIRGSNTQLTLRGKKLLEARGLGHSNHFSERFDKQVANDNRTETAVIRLLKGKQDATTTLFYWNYASLSLLLELRK